MQIFGEFAFQNTRSTRVLQRQNAISENINTDIPREFIHVMSGQLNSSVQHLDQDIRPPRSNSAMSNTDSDEDLDLDPIQPISTESEEEHDREIEAFRESRAAHRT